MRPVVHLETKREIICRDGDGASGVVGRHPCYSRTYNIGTSSHLIPRPDLVLDTSWGYLQGKLGEIETKSKNKNIRDLYKEIKDFKKGYQARVNVIKNENEEFLSDFNSILNSGKTTLANY